MSLTSYIVICWQFILSMHVYTHGCLKQNLIYYSYLTCFIIYFPLLVDSRQIVLKI